MTGNRERERERGSDTQQRDPDRESNPGPRQSPAHGMRAVPTELNGTPRLYVLKSGLLDLHLQ